MTTRAMAVGLVMALCISAPARVLAQDDAAAESEATEQKDDKTERERRPSRPGLAVPVAIVPGVIVHGLGHWVAGKPHTAKRLLAMEGIGFGLILAGGIPLLATGANRRINGPTIPLLVGGAGMFLLSWVGDIYGSAGGGVLDSAPRLQLPDLEAELGYAYVDDVQFDYSSFVVGKVDWRTGAWTVSPSAWIAADDDNQRIRLAVTRKLLGPGSHRATGDGSMFELRVAGTIHRFGDERFQTATWEAFANGRYDLDRLSASLDGSFAEMGVGVGVQQIDYKLQGAGADFYDVLLGRFAYGMYLGRPSGVNGELSLFYNHRRDDIAAGLSPGTANGSGFAGHFGVGGFVDFSDKLGVAGELVTGAAFIARVGLRFRLGGRK